LRPLFRQGLKSSLSAVSNPVQAVPFTSVEFESLQREARETKLWANDNEQYSRRNNIRIKGLVVKKEEDCRQAVAKFCRDKLHIHSIDSSVIDAAHPIQRQSYASILASASNAPSKTEAEPMVLVRFCRREHRDLVIRQRRQLKGTGLTVVEDLTSLNIQTLNRARNSTLVDKTWTWNGKIFALLKSGRKIIVKPFQPIQESEETN